MMNRYMWITVVLGTVLITAGCRQSTPPVSGGAEEAAPQLSSLGSWVAPALKPIGEETGLQPDQLAGKVLLVNVWAPWIGACRYEIPALNEVQTAFGPQGLQVMGIVMDQRPEAQVTADVADLKPAFPSGLLDGEPTELLRGLRVLPTKYLVGRDGEIYGRYTGVVPLETLKRELAPVLAAE